MMKKAIELASTETDTADLHQNDQPEQGRPTVGEEELAAYISKLNELWQEVCDTDASEVRQQHASLALNTSLFTLI